MKVEDVVCGTKLEPNEARSHGLVSNHHGQTFFFCCPGCKRDFDLNPARFVGVANPTYVPESIAAPHVVP